MKHFTLSQLRKFILAQRNDRPLDLWEGMPDNRTGCVLSHFAKSKGIKFTFATFNKIEYGLTIVAKFEKSGLHDLVAGRGIVPIACKVKTYGDLKKFLVQ